MGDEKKYQAAIPLSASGKRGAIGVPDSKCGVWRIAYGRCEALGKRCERSSSDGRHGAGSADL